MCYLSDQAVVQIHDIEKAIQNASGGGKGAGKEEVLAPEPQDVHSMLPGLTSDGYSSRYAHFSSMDQEQAIWDLATRRCVRLLKTRQYEMV